MRIIAGRKASPSLMLQEEEGRGIFLEVGHHVSSQLLTKEGKWEWSKISVQVCSRFKTTPKNRSLT